MPNNPCDSIPLFYTKLMSCNRNVRVVWKALERRVLERESNPSWSRHTHLTDSPTSGPAGYINTPAADEEYDEEIGASEDNTEDAMSGTLVGDKEILEKGEPRGEGPGRTGEMSKKMMKRQKHELRLERRYRRAVRLNQSRNNDERRGFANNDPLSGTNLIRARPARPCSYCHVPYHHKFAPFSNMKLVPW